MTERINWFDERTGEARYYGPLPGHEGVHCRALAKRYGACPACGATAARIAEKP